MTARSLRAGEPVLEVSDGGSTLRVYPHVYPTSDEFLTVEINGAADAVTLSWLQAMEVADALRDVLGQGTFKEDAIRAAERRGEARAVRREAHRLERMGLGGIGTMAEALYRLAEDIEAAGASS